MARESCHTPVTRNTTHTTIEQAARKCWRAVMGWGVVLNSLEDISFKVTTRSVRDRYNLLVKKKKNWSEEEKVSGINPRAHRNGWCFTWFDSMIGQGWLWKEKKIWRKKRVGTRNKKKISQNLCRKYKRKAECEKKTPRSTSDAINVLAEKWEKAHALKGRIEATETRNRESNSKSRVSSWPNKPHYAKAESLKTLD